MLRGHRELVVDALDGHGAPRPRPLPLGPVYARDTFGSDVVSKFLEDHDFDLMVRAHQVVEDGYEFFAQRQLVTLFSAPNYCGEFDNSGAVMSVDASLMCSFHILKPRSAAPGTPDTVGRGGR